MTDEHKTMQEPAHIADVFGPCPDCDNGTCTMNCGPGTFTFREVVAAAVLELESAKSDKAHASIVRLLKRISPNLLLSTMERYAARNNNPPTAEEDQAAKERHDST